MTIKDIPFELVFFLLVGSYVFFYFIDAVSVILTHTREGNNIVIL